MVKVRYKYDHFYNLRYLYINIPVLITNDICICEQIIIVHIVDSSEEKREPLRKDVRECRSNLKVKAISKT